MATPSEKLAESLDILKGLQDKGVVAIKSNAITRTHRERLLKNGFIREVYQGWHMVVPPNETMGDSTSWYSSYWPFCAQLLEDKYGENWCISPEQSLLLHAGNTSVPTQLIVRSPAAGNFSTELPHGTSLFHMKSPLPEKAETILQDGIRMLSLPSALIKVSENTFIKNPIDARTALSLIRNSSEILNTLLDGGHSTVAGRLAGAFRNIGKTKIADEIIDTMVKAGYTIRETDPFENKIPVSFSGRVPSPYINRIKLMWEEMRETILVHFPAAPGIPADKKSYMDRVDKSYVTDAYHSLSIEKYKVTPDLIEKVRSGSWNINKNEDDRKQKDAMAARGYWDAFQAVERSIEQILEGKNAGVVVDKDHGTWYRELFGPSLTAGILKPSELAGYRNHQVYIAGSMHTPMNKDAVRDAMPLLFELLEEEKEASVRTVLGHFVFVFIHPYMDGNGRMGRFLMNAMLASGGYPWTVIPVEMRDRYMKTLEKASVGQDIKPFTKFLAHLVGEAMDGRPVARL